MLPLYIMPPMPPMPPDGAASGVGKLATSAFAVIMSAAGGVHQGRTNHLTRRTQGNKSGGRQSVVAFTTQPCRCLPA